MAALPLMLATALGVVFATQVSINALVGRALGSPAAAGALSVAVTLPILLLWVRWQTPQLRLADLGVLPWWAYSAGAMGALILAGSAAITPVTGAAVFLVCLIAGQLAGSLVIDQIGAFGLEARPVTPVRAFGIIVVLIGAAMVCFGDRWGA